ncbi:MAG: hypothetical protein ACE5NG_07875 [bacterium]
MAEVRSSKYFNFFCILKIALISLYLTYQPSATIAQNASPLSGVDLTYGQFENPLFLPKSGKNVPGIYNNNLAHRLDEGKGFSSRTANGVPPFGFNNFELADLCDDLHKVTGATDTIDIIPKVRVRADKRQSKIAACVNIHNPGFYRIFTKIEYSDNSAGQFNESFYLQVSNEDSSIFTNPCDPNAGPYKVVEDVNADEDTLIRDAGVFYFNPGNNIIVLNHYVLIANDFPQFVHGEIEGPESVHLLQLILEFYGLALSKSASRNIVQPGGEYSYRLKIENLGAATANDIVLWDALPESLITPVNFTLVPPDSAAGDTLFWGFDSLASGEEINIKFDVKVAESLTFSSNDSIEIVNISRLTTACDTIHANAAVKVPPPPLNYDLQLTKTVSPDTVIQGDEFVYHIELANLGPNKAQDITLWDIVPDSLTIVNFNLEPPDSVTTDTLYWNYKALASGDTILIEFTAKVPPTLALPIIPFERVNTSLVTAENDTNDANNRDSTSVYVNVPPDNYDLELTKSASPDNVPEGIEFFYNIKIVNLGPNTASEITIWDVFPEFLTLSDFNLQPVLITRDTVFWYLDSLAAMDSINIIFKAMVTEPLPTTPYELINTSRLSAPEDVNDDNNTANSVVIIVPTNECIVLDRNVFEPDKGIPLSLNFKLSSTRLARLDVYDITGYHITTLAEKTFIAGLNTCFWDGLTENGDQVGSGVYVITLRSEQLICWKKVIVVR